MTRDIYDRSSKKGRHVTEVALRVSQLPTINELHENDRIAVEKQI